MAGILKQGLRSLWWILTWTWGNRKVHSHRTWCSWTVQEQLSSWSFSDAGKSVVIFHEVRRNSGSIARVFGENSGAFNPTRL